MRLYWTYISVLCISGHIAVKYLHYSRHRRGEFTKCPQSKNNKEQSISLSLPFYEMTWGRRWFYCLNVGSPELSASFSESFNAAAAAFYFFSEVHFNIVPQWKTIKDRIREAYYSAKWKRNHFYFLKKFLRGEKKNNIQATHDASAAELFCGLFSFFVSLFLFSFAGTSFYSQSGFTDHKVMLTVAFWVCFFFFSTARKWWYIFYEQPLISVCVFYCRAVKLLAGLTVWIHLQSYKSGHIATKVFFLLVVSFLAFLYPVPFSFLFFYIKASRTDRIRKKEKKNSGFLANILLI